MLLLTVIEGNLLYVVKGKLSQVCLSVLRIAQLYAVVIHSQMLASHRADVYRLQTAYAAVVLHLQTGEIAQGIGNTQGIEVLQLLAAKIL